MDNVHFRINLKDAHERSGVTAYQVAKETGLALGTVYKYSRSSDIKTDRLENPVIVLAQYYGVDWRDPAVVEVVYQNGNDDAKAG